LCCNVKGTYDELFTVICDPQYDRIWLDKCEPIVGADMAEMCADMLKSACTGTLYGEDAVSAYGQIWFNRDYTYDCAVEEMPAGYADALMQYTYRSDFQAIFSKNPLNSRH